MASCESQIQAPGTSGSSSLWSIQMFPTLKAMVADDTVDGSEIRQTHQLRLVVYAIIYRVLYIPGGAGFLPSTVALAELKGSPVFQFGVRNGG